MRKRSERVLELLKGGDVLKQERLHALKITNQIQGFGNNALSPCSSSSSSSPSSSRVSNCSSFGSFSTSSTPTWNEAEEFGNIDILKEKIPAKPKFEASHLWDPCAPIEEKDSLLNCEDDEEAEEGLHNYDGNVYEYNDSSKYGDQRLSGFLSGIRSKLGNASPVGRSDHSERVAFRCISDVSRAKGERTERQLSTKYY